MRRILLSLSLLLLTSLFALPALAGNWGESWGSMVWGATVAAVPTMGWLGGGLLVGLLASLGMRRSRRVSSGLVLLLALAYAPVAEAQVSVPNTLPTGSVADADAMNENFTAVVDGVNAALTTGSVSVPNTFTNGTTADADEVNANFTAVVDGVNTALANRATDCAGAGGTWEAGTSTCTPAPAASSYNCFVAGFCAKAAIEFDPALYEYTNEYDGHSPETETALGDGCVDLSGFTDSTCATEDGSNSVSMASVASVRAVMIVSVALIPTIDSFTFTAIY